MQLDNLKLSVTSYEEKITVITTEFNTKISELEEKCVLLATEN